MRHKFIVCLILLSSLCIDNYSASSISSTCYFDQTIQKLTQIGDLRRENCITINGNLSNDTSNLGCDAPRDNRYDLFDPENNPEKFELRIGVGLNELGYVVVLNLTISNITFNKLIVRLKNLPRNGKIYRQEIELQDNEVPQELSMYFGAWDYDWTEVQLFAEGSGGRKFFKEYLYLSPGIDIGDKLEKDGVFAYVDTTSREKVYLHLQPLPEKFNTSTLTVKFRCKDPGCEGNTVTTNLTSDKFPLEQTEFPKKGPYDFWLAIINSNGTEILSMDVAGFCMESSQKMLIIMIVSFGAIPIVMFFALYIMYIIFRRKVLNWLKSRKPNVLLVYSATHDLHIDVVVKLAEYLKGCQINVMLDVLDIPHVTDKNPTKWCDAAFKKANTIILISSPPGNSAIVVTRTIHRSLDNHAANLIHENRRCKDKRYLVVMLPYCDKNDVSPEGRMFKRLLHIPKQLHKLVNKIHHAKYTEVFDTPSEKELEKSIESASESIKNGVLDDKPKDPKKIIDLISPNKNGGVMIDIDGKTDIEGNVIDETIIAFIPKPFKANKIQAPSLEFYATDIKKLNLRGNEDT